MKNLFFKATLYAKWVIGFPAAVVQEYRRIRKMDREMHDALIDETFLDRASRGQHHRPDNPLVIRNKVNEIEA